LKPLSLIRRGVGVRSDLIRPAIGGQTFGHLLLKKGEGTEDSHLRRENNKFYLFIML